MTDSLISGDSIGTPIPTGRTVRRIRSVGGGTWKEHVMTTIETIPMQFNLWYRADMRRWVRTLADFDPAGYYFAGSGMVDATITDGVINFDRVLDAVFGGCNHGSDEEFDEFLAMNNRSLSVGDVVQLGEVAFMVEAVGWAQLTSEQFHALNKEAAR